MPNMCFNPNTLRGEQFVRDIIGCLGMKRDEAKVAFLTDILEFFTYVVKSQKNVHDLDSTIMTEKAATHVLAGSLLCLSFMIGVPKKDAAANKTHLWQSEEFLRHWKSGCLEPAEKKEAFDHLARCQNCCHSLAEGIRDKKWRLPAGAT